MHHFTYGEGPAAIPVAFDEAVICVSVVLEVPCSLAMVGAGSINGLVWPGS